MAKENTNPLANIPQVEKLLNEDVLKKTADVIGRPFVAKKAAEYLNGIRKKVMAGGEVPPFKICIDEINKLCRQTVRTKISPVINGTGIILHTNLGRSPLPDDIWAKAKETASGYSSIEMNLHDGNRGKRFQFLNECMCFLTGAEDALILNNNAAAVFLMLKVLAGGKEVIVSRGQQVQIGGGFRIPEILEMAGCKLVEVGTTNITTLSDIQNAINENTRMVLWVHSSNYKIRGFTEQPSVSQIKNMLPQNIILSVDQGSGNLDLNIPEEPTVSSIIKEGADIVCFSGDKILGGPQAGWIVGKTELLQAIATNQLMRTYRVGRAVASLMQETLIFYLNGGESSSKAAISLDQNKIKKRAEKIISNIKSGSGVLVQKNFSLGGGSTPDAGFSSWAVKLNTKIPCEKVKKSLREMPIPIIGFIEENSFYIHLASISEKDDEYVTDALNTCLDNC